MTCAEWVRNRRKELNLSQRELAERSDVPEQMIDDIESEQCPVHLGTKRKLEKVLGSYSPPLANRIGWY
jgi:transcriptional regulator with XRE-family HTH domain